MTPQVDKTGCQTLDSNVIREALSAGEGIQLRRQPAGEGLLQLERRRRLRAARGERDHRLQQGEFGGVGVCAVHERAVELEDVRYDSQGEILSWNAHLGRRARGSFIVWLPPRFRARSVISDAHSVEWKTGASGELIVTAEIQDAARFTLEVAHER
jgi:hypothetical protein